MPVSPSPRRSLLPTPPIAPPRLLPQPGPPQGWMGPRSVVRPAPRDGVLFLGLKRNGSGLSRRGARLGTSGQASPRPPYLGPHLAGPPAARALVLQPTATPGSLGD